MDAWLSLTQYILHRHGTWQPRTSPPTHPTTTHHTPRTTHASPPPPSVSSPLTTHHSPLTAHRSPLTADHSPHTTHHTHSATAHSLHFTSHFMHSVSVSHSIVILASHHIGISYAKRGNIRQCSNAATHQCSRGNAGIQQVRRQVMLNRTGEDGMNCFMGGHSPPPWENRKQGKKKKTEQ